MNVLYVWDADYPWDVRVEKICKSLASHGHQVHIVARNLKRRQEEEFSDGLYTHRLKCWKSDKLNYLLSFPLFFSPIWLRRLNQVSRDHGIQIIIVRDLPMAIAALWVGRQRGVPVLFDMAEDYVAMIREIWVTNKFKGLNLLVRNPLLARLVERYTLKRVTHTLIVVPEMNEVVVDGGGYATHTTVVGNTPPLTFFDGAPGATQELATHADSYKAIYTGGLEIMRGLQTVIAAMPEILVAIPNFVFVIVGDGETRKSLSQLAESAGVKDHIVWIGWVDHSRLADYIKACDLGIIPHLVSRHVDTTIPNKLFDYMGCGLPVVASNARPMARILREEQAGMTFESGDPHSLAKTVIAIHASDTAYGVNGKSAIGQKYNWAQDESRLLAAVDAMADPS